MAPPPLRICPHRLMANGVDATRSGALGDSTGRWRARPRHVRPWQAPGTPGQMAAGLIAASNRAMPPAPPGHAGPQARAARRGRAAAARLRPGCHRRSYRRLRRIWPRRCARDATAMGGARRRGKEATSYRQKGSLMPRRRSLRRQSLSQRGRRRRLRVRMPPRLAVRVSMPGLLRMPCPLSMEVAAMVRAMVSATVSSATVRALVSTARARASLPLPLASRARRCG